jgi:anti-sigma factor ChrR (cupin superfamily)
VEGIEFTLFRPGIERGIVYSDPKTGASTAFLRYLPGASVPLHRHDGYEHIVILEGEQLDDEGAYQAGQVLVHAPGSAHRVWTKTGCLVLAIWERPVVFLEQ